MGKQELVKFESELAALAAKTVQTEATAGDTDYFSLKGGVLSFKDKPVPNNMVEVIVLAQPIERSYYLGRYDPTKPQTPVCAALGVGNQELQPVSSSSDPQSQKCESCPKNQWGSAGNGSKGKACSEKRRLIILDAASVDNAESSDAVMALPVAALRTPVTSTKSFQQYLQNTVIATQRPLSTVVTRVKLVSDPKVQFRLEFEFVRSIDDMEVVKALLKKADLETDRQLAANSFVEPGSPVAESGKY